MMIEKHLCNQTIQKLLEDDSQVENLAEAQLHLENCAVCQERIELAGGEPWWWNEGKQLIASTAREAKERGIQIQIHDTKNKIKDYEVTAVTASLSPPRHMELLGRVDEYDIESLIGTGGMGIVFKGFDSELHRPVAIKFLSPRFIHHGVARQRFEREAKSLAAVSSEYVVPVYRINASREFPYFVMPFVQGVSLNDHVREVGCIEIRELVQISRQIACGLNAIHQRGLIHRDIKPANIILENECNRIVITDFGLARAPNDISLTCEGSLVGTPQYMSPEQSRNERLDFRSDLYSAGAVMYWLATGQPPFHHSDTVGLFEQIQKENHRPVRELNPQVPRKLEALIHRLLEKDPENRVAPAAKVEELLSKYEAFLADPIAHREPTIRQPGKGIFRKRFLQIGIALLVIFFIVSAFRVPPKIEHHFKNNLKNENQSTPELKPSPKMKDQEQNHDY